MASARRRHRVEHGAWQGQRDEGGGEGQAGDVEAAQQLTVAVRVVGTVADEGRELRKGGHVPKHGVVAGLALGEAELE